MKHILSIASAIALSGCVTSQNIVVDRRAYAAFSCPQLEQELVKLGAIESKASDQQSMASGTQVAATVVGSIATLGAGSVLNYVNMKNAEHNEKKAKAQLGNIYAIWDQKRCSEWLYERNRSRGSR